MANLNDFYNFKFKINSTIFKDHRRLMEWRRNDPLRYSRIVEGRWKDDENIHGDILGLTKEDGMMKNWISTILKNLRRIMERWRKDPGSYSKIDEGLWKDEEIFHCFILWSSKFDVKMQNRSWAIFNDRRRQMEK